MTGEEVIKLCRYIKAACPSQAFDEYTADVWAEILPPYLTLGECRAAVIAVKQRQPYVDVSDVIAEARRARSRAWDRENLRKLLDPAAYRAEVEAADARTLRLIGAHREKLAIEGPPRKRPVYTGKPARRAGPRVTAGRQAAESRAIRQAAGRHREGGCDCPCHQWPGVGEGVPCCRMRGMRYVASEGTYIPWPDDHREDEQ